MNWTVFQPNNLNQLLLESSIDPGLWWCLVEIAVVIGTLVHIEVSRNRKQWPCRMEETPQGSNRFPGNYCRPTKGCCGWQVQLHAKYNDTLTPRFLAHVYLSSAPSVYAIIRILRLVLAHVELHAVFTTGLWKGHIRGPCAFALVPVSEASCPALMVS